MTATEVTPGLDARRMTNRSVGFDGRVRIGFMVFGGMLALQSSQQLDATKFAYLAGSVVCLVGALAAVWRARASPEVRRASAWLVSSAALAVLLAASFLVARANQTPITDWVRDTAAYALFAAVPVFALDGRASATRRLLVGFLVAAGILGGLSWAIEWLGRRDILDLPFDRLVFPSGQLPGVLYLFALATAFASGRRGARWAILAGVVLGLFLVTGTRSSLLMLVSPLVMAAYAGRDRIRSSLRRYLAHVLVAGVVMLVFQLALALPVLIGPGQGVGEPRSTAATEPDGSGAASEPDGSGPAPIPGADVLGERFGSLPEVIGNPISDGSIKERLAQYRAAWALFVASPIIGVGPGHAIEWIDVSGYPRADYTADTPLVFPAKFGLVGVFVMLGVVYAYGATLRTALRRHRRSAITLTLVGYGVATVVGLPLGFPIEDKGASLALMLLLALAFGENAEPGAVGAAELEGLDAVAIETTSARL